MKYILLVICVFFIYLQTTFKSTANMKIWLFIYSIMILVIYNSLSLFMNTNELKYIFMIIFFTPFLFMSRKYIFYIYLTYKRFLYIMAIFFVFSNLIVIGNYILFDRLPAQGYANTFNIRFAGFYDMPNGFGMLNVFLLLYFIKLKKHLYLIPFLFLNILMALSISSYITLLLTILIYYGEKKSTWIIFLLITLFLLFFVTKYFELITNLYTLKEGSIHEHIRQILEITIYPILDGKIYFNESFILAFLTNYFPFSIFMILSLLVISLKYKNTDYGLYLIIFLIANLFIPNMYIFPNNVLFILNIIFLLRIKDFKNENHYRL